MAKSGHLATAVVCVSENVAPLAVLGGTFDPVHYAHLRCAEEARIKLGLDVLNLMPAGIPPHKETPQASQQQRLHMLQLALIEFPHLKIDTRELEREGPSYMVDSLQDLRSQFPQKPLLLLLGQDAANQLHRWHRWQMLFELTHIVIMTRPGKVPRYHPELALQMERRWSTNLESMLESEAGGIFSLAVTATSICATTIKKMIALGRSPRGMLPDRVLDYIHQQGLYLSSKSTGILL